MEVVISPPIALVCRSFVVSPVTWHSRHFHSLLLQEKLGVQVVETSKASNVTGQSTGQVMEEACSLEKFLDPEVPKVFGFFTPCSVYCLRARFGKNVSMFSSKHKSHVFYNRFSDMPVFLEFRIYRTFKQQVHNVLTTAFSCLGTTSSIFAQDPLASLEYTCLVSPHTALRLSSGKGKSGIIKVKTNGYI